MSIFARKASEPDEKVAADVKGKIGELVNSDIAEPQRQPVNDEEMVVSDLGFLLQRVSGNSMQEIDWIINDLTVLREWLQHEGDRIANEVVSYASLSHAAIQSTEAISARLTKMDRKSCPPPPCVPSLWSAGDCPRSSSSWRWRAGLCVQTVSTRASLERNCSRPSARTAIAVFAASPKDRFNWTLSNFLQQHYTSSSASAQALTAYLQAVDARAPVDACYPQLAHRSRHYVRRRRRRCRRIRQ